MAFQSATSDAATASAAAVKATVVVAVTAEAVASCGVAGGLIGVPELGVVCGAIAVPVVSAVYDYAATALTPFAGDVEGWVSDAWSFVKSQVGALACDLHLEHCDKPNGYDEVRLLQWKVLDSDPTTGPMKAWSDSVAAVGSAWQQACIKAGLPASTPMHVPLAALQAPPGSRMSDNPPQPLVLDGGAYVVAPSPPNLPQAVRDRGYAQTPEECLYAWLDDYNAGWRAPTGEDTLTGHGQPSYTFSSEAPGVVEDHAIYTMLDDGSLQSPGPYGLHIWNYASGCLEDPVCAPTLNHNLAVVYQQRLTALQKAVPAVIGGVIAGAVAKAVQKGTISTSGKITATVEADSGSSWLGWTLGLLAVGGAAYGGWVLWQRSKAEAK